MAKLPFINFSVDELIVYCQTMNTHEYTAFFKLSLKQWSMEMKPLDLNDIKWTSKVTGLSTKQLKTHLPSLKENFFFEVEGGYKSIFFSPIWNRVIELQKRKSLGGKISSEKRKILKSKENQNWKNDALKVLENSQRGSVEFQQLKQNKIKEKINKVNKGIAKNMNPFYLEEKEKKGSFRSKQFNNFHLAVSKNISRADHIDYLNKIDLLSDQDKEEIGQCFYDTKTLEQPLKLLETKIK